jgi:hypothetical protein
MNSKKKHLSPNTTQLHIALNWTKIHTKQIAENIIDLLFNFFFLNRDEPEKGQNKSKRRKRGWLSCSEKRWYTVSVRSITYLKGSEVKQNIKMRTRNGGYNG